MSYSFLCYGHQNILGTHKTTIEFTKDKHLTKSGDCIIGVNGDFDLDELKMFIQDKEKIRIIIKVDGEREEIHCKVNKGFNSDREMVIRRSDFSSERTLGIRADKGCCELSREFVGKLSKSNTKIMVIFE